jgi:S1-C subfamily serine protease
VASPGHAGIGSGTILAVNGTEVRVLTANHVAIFGSPRLRFDDGTVVPAHIVMQNAAHDLAIIAANVDPVRAATLHPATVAAPHSNEAVHIWGSGYGGPAFETGAIAAVGAKMPDGPANGRYALGCDTCHQGDSGGGIFNVQGQLVGVYVGYFVMDSGPRISVAEVPTADALNVARSAAPTTTASTNTARSSMVAALRLVK